MWLTSNKPTAVRTAMCSAISPPPGHGYSTGISHPPKSTILAFNAAMRCVQCRFLKRGCNGCCGVLIVYTSLETLLYPVTIGTTPRPRSNRRHSSVSRDIKI